MCRDLKQFFRPFFILISIFLLLFMNAQMFCLSVFFLFYIIIIHIIFLWRITYNFLFIFLLLIYLIYLIYIIYNNFYFLVLFIFAKFISNILIQYRSISSIRICSTILIFIILFFCLLLFILITFLINIIIIIICTFAKNTIFII